MDVDCWRRTSGDERGEGKWEHVWGEQAFDDMGGLLSKIEGPGVQRRASASRLRSPGWRFHYSACVSVQVVSEAACAEPSLGGARESNVNVLIEPEPEWCDPGAGGWVTRGLLCKVYRADGPLDGIYFESESE